MNPAMHNSDVLVPPDMMESFKKTLASLNRKAKKFGLPDIQVKSVEEQFFEVRREYVGRDFDWISQSLIPLRSARSSEAKEITCLNKISLEHPIVKLGAWQLIGKLDALEEGGALPFAISQSQDDQQHLRSLLGTKICCEHCKVNVARNGSFVLRDTQAQPGGAGEYKQVGSTCLQSFTGIDPAAALFLAQLHSVYKIWEGELDEYLDAARPNAISTEEFLTFVCHAANRSGFVSATKAREADDDFTEATYVSAWQLPDTMRNCAKSREAFIADRARAQQQAQDIIAWARSINESTPEPYLASVRLILSQDAIALQRRHLALAASAYAGYMRAHQSRTETPSLHVGQPGKPMEETLTIKRLVEIPTQYGLSRLVLMQDDRGNKLKWKSSSVPLDIVQGEGKSMLAKFKVKGHDEYNGQKQTTVTHLKVLSWVDAPPPPVDDDHEEQDEHYERERCR